MPQVEFYILQGTAPAARLKFACGLIEKAWNESRRVLVRLGDEAELEAMDTLLWTYSERAFVPHDRWAAGQPEGAVTLVARAVPPTLMEYAVLLDLALASEVVREAPPRVVEIIDADETRRRQGRERFRAYRDRGWAPTTLNIDPGTQASNG